MDEPSILRGVSGVSRGTSGVTLVDINVPRVESGISRGTSGVTRIDSSVTRDTSGVTRGASSVIRGESGITRGRRSVMFSYDTSGSESDDNEVLDETTTRPSHQSRSAPLRNRQLTQHNQSLVSVGGAEIPQRSKTSLSKASNKMTTTHEKLLEESKSLQDKLDDFFKKMDQHQQPKKKTLNTAALWNHDSRETQSVGSGKSMVYPMYVQRSKQSTPQSNNVFDKKDDEKGTSCRGIPHHSAKRAQRHVYSQGVRLERPKKGRSAKSWLH